MPQKMIFEVKMVSYLKLSFISFTSSIFSFAFLGIFSSLVKSHTILLYILYQKQNKFNRYKNK